MISTKTYLDLKKLKQKIKEADAIIIGAGAGLSTSAGFIYDGDRFKENFSDFIQKYGFKDMYEGGFYPFSTPEEFWAYWSRYIKINRYDELPSDVYENLLDIIKDKDYFVLTTNVDHCFQKSGFDKERLFYTQGDFGLWQCSVPCHNQTYDNQEVIKQMIEQQKDMKVPSDLIPYCPKCGAPMTMNLRSDNTFVEDKGWHAAAKRYHKFLENHQDKNILFLELGVGFNTPGIIKYPFWQMTLQNPKATFVTINKGEVIIPKEIKDRSIGIDSDIGEAIEILKK